MDYELDMRGAAAEKIYPLGEAFHGKNPEGTELAFNNYYMEKDGRPFEVRRLSPGFLDCVRRLYTEIAAQVRGPGARGHAALMGRLCLQAMALLLL